MQRVLVTGANGFIGAHVVRAALKRQLDVRVLVRPNSDRRNLEGLAVEICEGDLTDHESLDRAVAGVDTLFHVGARYDLSRRGRSAIWQANVEGTRALMQSALRHGLERVVHTSSVAAVGPPLDPRQPADERQWASPEAAPGPYEATKIASEGLVHALVASEGLPAVTTLPTAPIGPLDRKPTPTGRLITDAAHGAMPAYIRSAGLNIVHVSDVAEGHLLAAEQIEQGRVGERYLLGHAEGNLTLREIITRAATAGWYGSAAAGVAGGRRLPGRDRRRIPSRSATPSTPTRHHRRSPPRPSSAMVRPEQGHSGAAAAADGPGASVRGRRRLVRRARIRVGMTRKRVITSNLYRRWYRGLRDQRARDKVGTRIRRLRRGNLGDVRAVGRGVSELRIDYGPGYRIYFIERGDSLVILLAGGDKRSQARDIRRAIEIARSL